MGRASCVVFAWVTRSIGDVHRFVQHAKDRQRSFIERESDEVARLLRRLPAFTRVAQVEKMDAVWQIGALPRTRAQRVFAKQQDRPVDQRFVSVLRLGAELAA